MTSEECVRRGTRAKLRLPGAGTCIVSGLGRCNLSPIRYKRKIATALKGNNEILLLHTSVSKLPVPRRDNRTFTYPAKGATRAYKRSFRTTVLLDTTEVLGRRRDGLGKAIGFVFRPTRRAFRKDGGVVRRKVLRGPGMSTTLTCRMSPKGVPIKLFVCGSGNAVVCSISKFGVAIGKGNSRKTCPRTNISPVGVKMRVRLTLRRLVTERASPTRTYILAVKRFGTNRTTGVVPRATILRKAVHAGGAGRHRLLIHQVGRITRGATTICGNDIGVRVVSRIPPLVYGPTLASRVVKCVGRVSVPNLAPIPSIDTDTSRSFTIVTRGIPDAFVCLSTNCASRQKACPTRGPGMRFGRSIYPVNITYLTRYTIG